jgi:hypothetical protein
MFPPLSTKWLEQVQDAKDWKHYSREDFERLRQKYGVSWIVTEQSGPANLDCPYQNAVVRVCRIG